MIIEEELLINFGAELIHFKKSQVLFEEDNDPVYYFQVKKGKIKLINFHHEKKEFIHSIHQEGDPVGETFLFTQYKYPVDAVLMEDSVVLRLERSKLLKLLASDFQIQKKFLHYLAEKSYYHYVFLDSLTSHDSTHQLLTLLNYLKENKSGSNTDKNKSFSYQIPYTRKEIASLTGLRIETVIRAFKKMEAENLIKITEGKVYY